MPDLANLVMDGAKEKVNFALPKPAMEYIDKIAALSGERNRSAALRRIIREHARYESELALGLLKRTTSKIHAA